MRVSKILNLKFDGFENVPTPPISRNTDEELASTQEDTQESQ